MKSESIALSETVTSPRPLLWALACSSVITWMNSVHRGKSPRLIVSNRSRPLLSRSFATAAAAAWSVRFSMPCCEQKWNLSQPQAAFAQHAAIPCGIPDPVSST